MEFRGRGIAEAWRTYAEAGGFAVVDDWRDADCAFFPSDSMLVEEALGEVPTVGYFWGWPPESIRAPTPAQHQHMTRQLELMARCTMLCVPSYQTYDEACVLGLRAHLLVPGADTKLLDTAPEIVGRTSEVLFISRLEPYKELHTLMEGLSLLDPSPPLVVCGPGNWMPYQEIATKFGLKVQFCEPSDEEKLLLIRRAAVLVHPSSYEGFGLPPLEALYLATPVICSDLPWSRWLLQEDALFFSSQAGLAGALAQVLMHPESVRERTQRGQKRVADYLNLERATRELAQVFHEAIRVFCGEQMRRHPERAAEIYDRDHRRNWAFKAQQFDPQWARHWRAERFVRELHAAGAKKILDCGSGAVYPTIFARGGFDVVAYDISEECLRQVEHVAAKWGVSGQVQTQQGRAQQLPYQEDEFDAVVLGEILEHVADPEVVLSEAYRVVRPAGIVVASTPVGAHHWDPLHIASERGGWDDETLGRLVGPYSDRVTRLEKIAEEGTEPSCFLFCIEKR